MFKIRTSKLDEDRAEARLDRLTRNLEPLGSGLYATVYALDQNRVLKVFRRDEGYETYLDYLSKQTEHNPWTPKVYSALKYPSIGKTAVVLERLRKNENAESFFNDCSDGWPILCDIQNYFETEFYPRAQWIHRAPHLKRLLEDLAGLADLHNRSNGWSFDIDFHSGNFMVRNRYQLVLTDPLS